MTGSHGTVLQYVICMKIVRFVILLSGCSGRILVDAVSVWKTVSEVAAWGTQIYIGV